MVTRHGNMIFGVYGRSCPVIKRLYEKRLLRSDLAACNLARFAEKILCLYIVGKAAFWIPRPRWGNEFASPL